MKKKNGLSAGLLPALSALIATTAMAAITTTVVDAPFAGDTQRFLYVKPDAPVANLVVIPGGDGIFGIRNDGTMDSVTGTCSPFGRVRDGLAGRGVAVALVDATAAGFVRNTNGILETIRYMRERHDVPTWITGGSSSTAVAAFLASTLSGDIPGGVIFFSPDRPTTPVASIRRPALVVYHTLDTGQFGSQMYNALTAASVRERVALTGGSNAGCTYHLFNGLDAEFLATTAGFIDKYNAEPAPTLPRNYTDLWWNPAESGWGLNLNHQGGTLFGTLFTYDANRAPLWLVMSGGTLQADGITFTGDLYRTTGPAFNAIPFTPIGAANLTLVGTMTASFAGENAGTLRYTVNGVEVNKAIERQVYGSRGSRCQPTTASRATATNYQDLWWNPAESGWGLNVTHQDNTLFATLFTYDAAGRDLWLVMSAGTRQPDGSYLGDLYQTSGPAFNASPFVGVSVAPVGTMRLQFSNGENGTLTYTYNGVPVTKAITRQVFSSPVPACN